MVVEELRKNSGLTAEALQVWVSTEGMRWRKDLPLDRKIIAPSFSS